MSDSNQNTTVSIRYIKKKRRKEDNVNKTKVVWHGEGDVQEYPKHLAPAILQHEDVWVIANSAQDPFAAHEYTRAQRSGADEVQGEDQASVPQSEKTPEQKSQVSLPQAEGPQVVELKVNDVTIPQGAYYVMLVPEAGVAKQMELMVGALQQLAAKGGYSIPAVAIEGELFPLSNKPAPVETADHQMADGSTQTRVSEVITPETVDSMAHDDKDTLKAWASEHLHIDLNKRFSNEKLIDQMRLAAEVYQSELAYVGDPALFKDAYKQSLQAHDMFNPEIVKVL